MIVTVILGNGERITDWKNKRQPLKTGPATTSRRTYLLVPLYIATCIWLMTIVLERFQDDF